MSSHVNNNSSPSSATSSLTTTTTTATSTDPMQSWWESISKARSRIHALAAVLPAAAPSLLPLADSDRPALSLLSSPAAYSALSSALSAPHSGHGGDPLCHWLYDTFLSQDPHLSLLVLSYLPLLCGTYLTRIHANSHSTPHNSQNSHFTPGNSNSTPESLSGFEAVLLGVYSSEVKSRNGKAVLVSIPDLAVPSIYHTPIKRNGLDGNNNDNNNGGVGVLCGPLEPLVAVKATKRASIVGVVLDCYYRQISHMPVWSKLEFCRFASAWAGQDCPCKNEFDSIVNQGNHDIDNRINRVDENVNGFDGVDGVIEEEVVEGMANLAIQIVEDDVDLKGGRIPLPWELLQPVLRILGHCLLAPLSGQEVKDSAGVAVRRLYARATHDLVPQAILATRSLIQLDRRARESARVVAGAASTASASSNANTPTKARKPEILLVSK